jgi:hypothetical protein
LNEEEVKWEVYGSLYVRQLISRRDISRDVISGWHKKNKYKRRSLIRQIENMEVSQEVLDNAISFYERYST